MLDSIDIRDAYFDSILEAARLNKNILVLSADMDAFSLRILEKELPKQYLNVGVSEQNMMNVAAGLALSGKIVFCYSIAAFATMRCFEQIKVNICSMNLPVTIVGAGAGFSFGYDGPTHHGHQDLSSMRLLPEMSIMELSSNDLAMKSVKYSLGGNGPCYVRLDKGRFPNWSAEEVDFNKGYRILRPLQKHNIVTNGFMAERVCGVADKLAGIGQDYGVIDLFLVKPVADIFTTEILLGSENIISVEESCGMGGLGSLLADLISFNNLSCRLNKIAAPDRQFIEYGTRDWFHEKYKIDEAGIYKQLNNFFMKSKKLV